ncbi:MAG: RsiV family protein [Candidatus Shapirobacteria bacterium]|nr:RsiV family protein [Candidatus Shapirobacteria bacterium]
MKRIGLFLILVLVIGLLLFSVLQRNKTTNQNNTNEPITKKMDDEFKDINNYKSINCPDITNLKDKEVQDILNKKIKDYVAKIVSDEHMDEAILVEEIEQGPNNNWLDVYCRTIQNNNIISITINTSSYGAGAAHPNNYETTMSYSKKDGKILSLDSLFKPNTDYLKIITERTRYYLNKDHGIDPQWIIDGTSSESSLSSFMVENNGLKITFDPYQVAPYSEGTIEVLIPKSELGPNYLY